jgi:putative DNA primase/helicase
VNVDRVELYLTAPEERVPVVPVSEPDHEDVAGDDLAVAPDGLRLTDAGNARRLIGLAGGKVRYAHAWGRWIVYRDGRWIVDQNDVLITEMAKRVSRHLMGMASELYKEMRDLVWNAALRAESAGSIAAMIRLARGIPGVIVNHEDLDADPLILNCTNGTIDLRTGQLRQHDPTDLCTQQAPVDYDPEAVAPLWEKCLERWQPDPEVREYLQREAGAAATGRQTETLSIHYGLGANGKSKFFGAVQHTLGSYAVVPHKSLIVASRHEQHATVVASLFRARLAVASETSESAKINEEQVKNLTGNDRLAARRMREDEWNFDPSHTLVMFSNILPTIKGTDNGIWRRVRMVPWDVTIPEAEQDEALGDKLDAELSGVLRWMVEGSVRYLEVGIGAPERIVASTAAFRGDQDTVARFLTEAGIVFDPMGRTPTTDLTEAHEAWVDDNGIADRGHWQRVAKELTKRGGRAGRTKSLGRLWDGVTMRGPEQESAGQTANHSTGVTGVTALPVNPGFTPYAKPTGRGDTPVTPTTKNERKRAANSVPEMSGEELSTS